MSDTYAPTQAQFDSDVANWTMQVLLDSGLYRHLRFRLRGGGFTWFDVLTWPGRLVITGDCETFVFTRLEDMFEFFRSGGTRINPGYWQEKVIDGRERCRKFDWDNFRAAALAQFDRATENKEDQEPREHARKDLEDTLDESEPDIYGAVELVRTYSYRPGAYGTPVYFQFDYEDSSLTGEDWDFHYIWCCRAIVFAIKQYDQHKADLQRQENHDGVAI